MNTVELKKNIVVNDIISSKHDNNFNLLRIIAALGVIYGHSFYLFTPDGSYDILAKLFPFTYSGSISVNMFFFISGILVTQSYFNSKSVYKFMTMRFFRIWPGLTLCLLATMFIIGPIFTNLNTKEYLLNMDTYRYLTNLTLLLHSFNNYLPGVFMNGLEKGIVNSSLWTLSYEVFCYVVLLIGLHTVISIKNNRKYAYKIIACLVLLIFLIYPSGYTHYVISVLSEKHIHRFFFFFGFGVIFYLFRNKIPIKLLFLLALASICVILHFTADGSALYKLLFDLTFIYTIIYLAYLPVLRKLKFDSDYSYGVYLYGYLVQQMVAVLFKFTPYQSMLVTFLYYWASFHGIL
jgi:peptidoglycan/LPS O-acetylase OafA/YrhL